MPKTTILVGLDGTEQGDKVLEFAKTRLGQIDDCLLLICYVIEWSPFAFQTAEENEKRHARREEELRVAQERIIDPAVSQVAAEGYTVKGIVQHGHAAEVLEAIANEYGASQIVIGRHSARSVREHVFGSVSVRLAASSPVPVTIIP
ncbi:universal stress protein [Acuticoccus sediminis]|uniref:Universal stress protein n=1 Tax=Acuticoccus sediminis TaxID=2184697 RepID=A0A8B2NPF5_9HYPH|nr:universal stress protein [Acuticoccus sediminis]RAH98979.1 universal stress protein [Acuticoccus sediminis]